MSASHVVVVDSRARRAVVKVAPGRHLSDVLQEACSKLGLKAEQYGLRHNNKQIDLSRTIRLSNLSSGAKLELVLLSRSPSVVSVALQLPEPEAHNVPSGRLVDKFPSTTTLWLVLRKFESSPPGGGGGGFNFTGRGVPRIAEGASGHGRLYYETPVLQFMQRELSSFSDLQKTLGQLGLNSGSAMLRLSFRATEQPLEEAQAEIEGYFKSIESEPSAGAHSGSITKLESRPDPTNPDAVVDGADTKSPPDTPIEEKDEEPAPTEVAVPGTVAATEPTEQEIEDDNTIVGPDQRPVSIFAPPSGPTPQAVHHNFNEVDYEPTIDHAKQHQSRLSMSGRNKRLPSEAELQAQQEATSRKLSTVKEVELKIRLPDQTQLVSKFTAADTSLTLYNFVQSMLQRPEQPFTLSYTSPKGPKVIPRPKPSSDGSSTTTKNGEQQAGNVRLIQDLGFSGRMLITFAWDADAANDVRRGGSVLKPAFAAAARELTVEDVGSKAGLDGPEGNDNTSGMTQAKADTSNERKGGSGRKGMPKWLKLPGKK